MVLYDYVVINKVKKSSFDSTLIRRCYFGNYGFTQACWQWQVVAIINTEFNITKWAKIEASDANW